VGRRDDEPEVLREKRDRRRRQHTREDGGSARLDDASRERLLELGPGAAGVSSDEDAAAARPERHGASEALDELRRERVADDAADAVGPEPASFPRLGSGEQPVHV
jgi:hypothetical protein